MGKLRLLMSGGNMKILVACEESQRVTKAFRKKGHEAYSCDILDCSGGHPEWHMKEDVIHLLSETRYWDIVIAFPPCTHLAVSGARWFPDKIKDGRQQKAIDFFMSLVNCNCEKIAIENPVCIMATKYRKPDQYIQPYEYGHPETKKTGLWLKNLPLLKPTKIIKPKYIIGKDGKRYSPTHYMTQFSAMKYNGTDRATARSKTFQGIADAMADQWG
jgi:site-specific DNA-cytosine methylase